MNFSLSANMSGFCSDSHIYIFCIHSNTLIEHQGQYVVVISQAGVGYHCYYTRPRVKPEVEC